MIRRVVPASIRNFMTTTTVSEARAPALPKDRTLVGALALFLGLGVIFLVGFAPVSAVHNAAHDTRHSAAFPCH
jgi:cobalt transporter subunit CbtB